MIRFNKSCSLIGLLILVSCATTSVVDKPVQPATVKFVPASKEKTPEDIVNEWLTFAKEQKWEEMAKIAQMTWVNKKGSKAAEEISWNYDFFDIKGWRIISTSKQRDTFYTITVEVDTQLGEKTMKANVIREISPYKESVNGKWGINPISAMLRGKSGTSGRSSYSKQWFQVGNLHNSTVAQWKSATYQNKLATAADWLAATKWKGYLKSPADFDKLKVKAQMLVKAVDEVVTVKKTDSLQVIEIAAAIITMSYDLGP